MADGIEVLFKRRDRTGWSRLVGRHVYSGFGETSKYTRTLILIARSKFLDMIVEENANSIVASVGEAP